MKILVTGGTGFIGRNLIEKLSGSYTVLAPTRQQLDLSDSDAVRSYLEKHGVDAVIHSATTPGHRNAPAVADLASKNIRMFLNFARNRHLFGKMLYLGSGATYDMRYCVPRMPETYFDTYVPVDSHGFSKYVIASLIEGYDNIVELRLFGIFGKYEDYAIRFISNAICKCLFDLPITIKQNRRFDYLYIEDLVPVLEYFLRHEADHKVYNVTPDQTVELKWLAELIRGYSGKNMDIEIVEPGTGLEYSGDNSRLRQQMPSLRFTPITESVRALFEWYVHHRHLVKKELLLVDK